MAAASAALPAEILLDYTYDIAVVSGTVTSQTMH